MRRRRRRGDGSSAGTRWRWPTAVNLAWAVCWVGVAYAVGGGPESEEASTSTETNSVFHEPELDGRVQRRCSFSAMKPWKYGTALSLSAMPTLLSARCDASDATRGTLIEPGTSRDQAGACKRRPWCWDSQVLRISLKNRWLAQKGLGRIFFTATFSSPWAAPLRFFLGSRSRTDSSRPVTLEKLFM